MKWIKGEFEKEKNAFGFKSLRKIKSIRDTQTGTSNKKRDKSRDALLPGKRISRTGKIYYEGRKNRSDLKGSNI
jgi:hypothetical protein